MNTYEKDVMQRSIEKIYTDFVTKVSEGRKMTFAGVDSIGQGRVWTGSRGLDNGLVDEIGGLKEAIEGAAKLAGTDDYIIKEYPVIEDPYTKLISGLTGEIRMKMLTRELGTNIRYYNELKELSGLSGIQARLPYFIEIR
jgi:protease-4